MPKKREKINVGMAFQVKGPEEGSGIDPSDEATITAAIEELGYTVDDFVCEKSVMNKRWEGEGHERREVDYLMPLGGKIHVSGLHCNECEPRITEAIEGHGYQVFNTIAKQLPGRQTWGDGTLKPGSILHLDNPPVEEEPEPEPEEEEREPGTTGDILADLMAGAKTK